MPRMHKLQEPQEEMAQKAKRAAKKRATARRAQEVSDTRTGMPKRYLPPCVSTPCCHGTAFMGERDVESVY
jgi:hypothetical protein